MITIFNRRLNYTSFLWEKLIQNKKVLDNNKIKYFEKVVNRRSALPFGNGIQQSRAGSFN